MANILLIDDENISRMAMESLFTAYGSCKSFASGRLAVAAYKNFLKTGEKIDLIILDISLKSENGVDVLKEIRQLEEKIGIEKQDRSKIIMATGNSDIEIVRECIEEGCDDYLVKPLRAEIIAPKMEKFNFSPV